MRLFVGAGEASGDGILAAILRALKARAADPAAPLDVRGFGGPQCAAEGLVSPFDLSDLAVNGIGDVLRRGAFLLRARAALRHELEAFRPDAAILVDYPGMNVPLARRARALGIPVLYVAPPQLWAYKNPARRLARLRRALEGVSLHVLFPFEASEYPAWNPGITQGHFFPLPAFETARERSGARLLLCPGSRRDVMRRNLPLWLARVRSFFGTLEGVDVLVPPFLENDARALCASAPRSGDDGIRQGRDMPGPCEPVVVTDRDTAFTHAGAAIAFPGTITLELFLHRIPTRVWGVLDPLTLWAGRRALRGPRVALPNAIAGEALLPEWIGTARDFRAAPPAIPDALSDWNPDATADAVRAVWALMGSADGAARAAENIQSRTTPPSPPPS